MLILLVIMIAGRVRRYDGLVRMVWRHQFTTNYDWNEDSGTWDSMGRNFVQDQQSTELQLWWAGASHLLPSLWNPANFLNPDRSPLLWLQSNLATLEPMKTVPGRIRGYFSIFGCGNIFNIKIRECCKMLSRILKPRSGTCLFNYDYFGLKKTETVMRIFGGE